jgi:iron complex outermembrane receptor protein
VAGGAGLYYDTLPGPGAVNLTGIGIAGGIPELQPESASPRGRSARSWRRSPCRGSTPEVTYFDIDYKNQIQALRGTPGLADQPALRVVRDPQSDRRRRSPRSAPRACRSTIPACSPGTVQFIADGRRQNLGKSKISGIDFVTSYTWDWGEWTLDAGVNGSYFLNYDFEAVPNSGFVDVLNTIAFPQKFRMQADAGVAYGNFQGRVTLNHLSGYDNTAAPTVQRVDSYQTVDLHLGLDVTEHANIAVQVRNLFDADPPFVDAATGYDPQSANPLPRLFVINARFKY